MGSYNKGEGKIYTEKGKSIFIFIIKRRERRGVQVH